MMPVRWATGDRVCVARTRDRRLRSDGAIRPRSASWLDRYPPSDAVTLANPLGAGSVRLAFIPIGAGEDASVVAASCAADFPSGRSGSCSRSLRIRRRSRSADGRRSMRCSA